MKTFYVFTCIIPWNHAYVYVYVRTYVRTYQMVRMYVRYWMVDYRLRGTTRSQIDQTYRVLDAAGVPASLRGGASHVMLRIRQSSSLGKNSEVHVYASSTYTSTYRYGPLSS
jgi:hypothetical protein